MTNFELSDLEQAIMGRLLRLNQVNETLERANNYLVSEAELDQRKIADLLGKTEQLNKHIRELDSWLEDAEMIADARVDEINGLRGELKYLDQKNKELTNKAANFEASWKRATQWAEDLSETIQTLQKECDELKKKYESDINETSRLVSQLQELQTERDRLKAQIQLKDAKIKGLAERNVALKSRNPDHIWVVTGKGESGSDYSPVAFAAKPSTETLKWLAHRWDGIAERRGGPGYDGTYVHLTIEELKVREGR